MAITKITIEDGCTACGLCAQICPDVFDVADIATVKAGVDLNSLEAQINEAADSCPVTCIKVS